MHYFAPVKDYPVQALIDLTPFTGVFLPGGPEGTFSYKQNIERKAEVDQKTKGYAAYGNCQETPSLKKL